MRVRLIGADGRRGQLIIWRDGPGAVPQGCRRSRFRYPRVDYGGKPGLGQQPGSALLTNLFSSRPSRYLEPTCQICVGESGSTSLSQENIKRPPPSLLFFLKVRHHLQRSDVDNHAPKCPPRFLCPSMGSDPVLDLP